MSHFTVVVVLDSPEDLEEALAPFNENTEVEPYRDVIGHVAADAKRARQYFKDNPQSAPRVYDTSIEGEGAVEVMKRYDHGRNPTREEIDQLSDETIVLHYHDADHDPSVRIEGEEVIHDSRYNPLSEWDWYQVGGRWQGFFKAKPGSESILGERSLLIEAGVVPVNSCDVVKVKDVDWDAMRCEIRERANTQYDEYEAATSGLVPPTPWKTLVDQVLAANDITVDYDTWVAQHENDEDDSWKSQYRLAVDRARGIFNSNEWVQAVFRARLWESDPEYWYAHLDSKDAREAFVKQRELSAGVPFAFLHEGQWIERGSMGWFGMVSDEQDRDVWNEKAQELYSSLDPDKWLVLVDCHV